MATTQKSPSKTSFVKEFVGYNPDANVKAVNDAWKAAGNTGTIGDSLIYQMKAEMRLNGNRRGNSQKAKTPPAKPKTASKPKATTKASKTATTPGKTLFAKEYLIDHPHSNFKALNEAWAAAGMQGSISETVVNKMRSQLGLAGNLRAKSTPAMNGQKRGRSTTDRPVAVDGPPAEQSQRSHGHRSSVLLGVEAEIDRLIFALMGLGDLSEIESTLRAARRLVYGALSS